MGAFYVARNVGYGGPIITEDAMHSGEFVPGPRPPLTPAVATPPRPTARSALRGERPVPGLGDEESIVIGMLDPPM